MPSDDDDVAPPNAIERRVEQILGRRERVVPNGGIAVEYLVHWSDGDASEDSWEELRNLPSCHRQLREFQRVTRT